MIVFKLNCDIAQLFQKCRTNQGLKHILAGNYKDVMLDSDQGWFLNPPENLRQILRTI